MIREAFRHYLLCSSLLIGCLHQTRLMNSKPGVDIVHRLRDRAYGGKASDRLLEEAADEIERLRITDVEREALLDSALAYESDPDDWECSKIATTLRGLLERLSCRAPQHVPETYVKNDENSGDSPTIRVSSDPRNGSVAPITDAELEAIGWAMAALAGQMPEPKRETLRRLLERVS